MDLSNLSTSLHETSSSNRRTVHLRSAEDELNAVFRSSALGLTTLYRQGVTVAKTSYDKGYGDALAHVLELWEKDKGWLRGYLQRRIEALDCDDEEEIEKPKKQEELQQKEVGGGGESSRRGGKRSRSDISRMDEESPVTDSRSNTMTGTSTLGFSSGFSFSTPLTMPLQSHASLTKHTRNTPTNTRTEPPTGARVIKTSSTPAAQRRRLQKLKGLRSGARDKIIEIKQPHQDDMIQDEDEAWTDDDHTPTPTPTSTITSTAAGGKEGEKKGTRVIWTDQTAKVEQGVLERKDRRKRRRTKPTKDAAGEEEQLGHSSREREVEGFTYHS